MNFDIISLFPESFISYFSVSILKRAQEENLISISTYNLRDYTHDKHKTVDDTPYGGGAGMLLKVEPLAEAIEAVQAESGIWNLESPTPHPRGLESSPRAGELEEMKTRTILFSAKGKTFTQADARRLAEYDRLILICGRYEGIDERVVENFVDEEFSIGNYVLTGGEIPAMIVVDAVARLLPGVLGNAESAETESHCVEGEVEYPQYTKPEEFRGYKVPEVLLSGNHGEIAKWRKAQSEKMSKKLMRQI